MKLWHATFALQGQAGDETASPRVMSADFYLPTRDEVRRQIINKGGWPIEVKERREATFTFLDTRSTGWQLQLLRALRFQTANASAGSALLQIIEAEQDDQRRVVSLPARAVLKGGGTFAEALKAMRLFDSTTMAIITAGEKTREMRGVINYAIQHIEERTIQTRSLKTTLGWLALDIGSVVVTIGGTQWGFIPYLRASGISSANQDAVKNFHASLDWAAQMNGALALFTTAAIAGATTIAVAHLRNKDDPDHWSARAIRRLPAFGPFLLASSLSDTAKTMARLARSAVPLEEALRIVEASANSPTVKGYWRNARQKILAGSSPQRALATDPLTRVEQGQVGTYETTEQLAEVFETISEERKLEAKDGMRRIIQLGIAILGGLFAAVFALTLYLVMLQNEGLLQTINTMRG